MKPALARRFPSSVAAGTATLIGAEGGRQAGLHSCSWEGVRVADDIYSVSEIVGSSTESIDDAIRGAVERASKTVRNLDWFELREIRGHIDNERVGHFQVTIKVGFRLEEPS